MSPDLLKSFLEVARELSFTRAAEQLALTQSAVSRQIRQLEQTLGVRLFERIGKAVYLTDAGQTLRPLADSILAQIDRASETVSGCAGSEHGRLRIGASTTPGYYVLPAILGRFCQSHPGVELQYRVENSQSVEHRVLQNELDLGFVGERLKNESLLIEPIADDEIVCYCGRSHPLARTRNIRPAMLTDTTWIMREHGSATRQLFERHLKSAGMTMARVIELNSTEAIKALVQEGVGVSCISIHGIRQELHRRRFHRVSLPGKPLRRQIFLVRHPDKYVSPTMREFLELLPRR